MYKTILRLIKISSNYSNWMLLATFTGFLTIGSGVGLLMTSAYIISKAALPVSIADLQVGIVGVRFFGIFRGVFRYIERLISHEVTFRLLANFRVWFFSSLEPLAPAETIYHKSGDLLNRFVTDVQELQNIFLRVLAPPMIAVAVLILMWVLFGIFDILFSVVFMIFYLAAAFFIPFIAFKTSHKTGLEIVNVKSRLQVKSIELVQGISELAIYDTNYSHIREMERLNFRLTSLQQKISLIDGLTRSSIGLLMNGAVVSLLFFGTKLVNVGGMDGVYLSVIILGVMASFEALLPLPVAFQNLSRSVQAASRLFEIIDSNGKTSRKATKPQLINNWDIEFENISFAYEDTKILNNVSLTIPQGKKIVIAGQSGSGKSTIVNLLLRFWQPDTGEIRLGGKNIADLDEKFLHDQLSVMNQDYFLFNTTLKDNLHLADKNATSDRLDWAINQSHLQDKIKALPNHFDTVLGEHGLTLSGGERQRLCLARTFLKDAPVYILDEPSTNLDSENERIIFDSIFNISNDKSVLLITHKLKYLDQADYIYYLDEGIIKEEGTFAELLKESGLFKSVFELQNQVIDFKPE